MPTPWRGVAENVRIALTRCYSTVASKSISEIRFYAIFLRQVLENAQAISSPFWSAKR